MTTPTASRPPAGMPPHLWELAKRDVRGAVPDHVRNAADASDRAPRNVRAIARRAAAAGGTLGAAAAAAAFAAGPAVAGAPVDLASFDGAGASFGGPGPVGGAGDGADGVHGVHRPDGGHDGGHDGGGGTGGGYGGGASTGVEGSLADGPVSSGLGSTFQVEEGPPGAETTLTVSIFQDVTVVETADGMFQVDAYQFIVITDSDGNEYVFREHYQVIVPDPPGQETDLIIHETGHVHVVENPDGSFTPVSVDHGIEVFVGSDGDGRDEIGIRQDESVRITEHGRPDADDTTIQLTERASTDSQDIGDEAFSEIDQSTRTGDAPPSWSEHPGPGFDEVPSGPATPAPSGSAPPTGFPHPSGSPGPVGNGTVPGDDTLPGQGTTGTPSTGTPSTGTPSTGTPSTSSPAAGASSTGAASTATPSTAPTGAASGTTAATGTATSAGVAVAAPTYAPGGGATISTLDSSLVPESATEVSWSGSPQDAESGPGDRGAEQPSGPAEVFGTPTTAPTSPGRASDASLPADGSTSPAPSSGPGASDTDQTDASAPGDGASTTSQALDEGADTDSGSSDDGSGTSGFGDSGNEEAGDGGREGPTDQDVGGTDDDADSALIG